MHPIRRDSIAWLLLLALALTLAPSRLQASEPGVEPNGDEYQLLANAGMEAFDSPYREYDGVDCQVASHWQRFWDDGAEPYWMDTRTFANSHLGCGWVERIEGDTSQLVFSSEPYSAGLWQRVTGLTPGLGYGFHAAMLTIYETSAQEPVDGTMIKQVGIDPAGGTDPRSANIVWSEPNGEDQAWDIDNRTAIFAGGPAATVFIRLISQYASGYPSLLNLSFLDSAILAQTGTVMAVSPEASEDTQFMVSWDNALASPDATIRWYDVQWSDAADGFWHDWKVKTTELSAAFTGELGHAYRFRARVWQRYPNGAHLVSPYREGGDTETCVGAQLRGRVLGPEGQGITGAAVGLLGTDYRATSGPGGEVVLAVPPLEGPQAATVEHPAWLAPPPVYGLDFDLTGSLVLTWTLRPADDVVVNGGFEEEGLQGWQVASGTAEPVADPVHSGYRAVALGGSETNSLSQTVELQGAWEPALSFWYRPGGLGEDVTFDVALTVVGTDASPSAPASETLPVTSTQAVCLPPLGGEGWQHFWCYPGPRDAPLTGTVTVEFRLAGEPEDSAVVLLDEVSLGATPGGPFKALLPLIARSYP